MANHVYVIYMPKELVRSRQEQSERLGEKEKANADDMTGILARQ
jgi:hypothetical protein